MFARDGLPVVVVVLVQEGDLEELLFGAQAHQKAAPIWLPLYKLVQGLSRKMISRKTYALAGLKVDLYGKTIMLAYFADVDDKCVRKPKRGAQSSASPFSNCRRA
jgi:hypothetical protein